MSGGCLGFLNHEKYVRENPTPKKNLIYIYIYILIWFCTYIHWAAAFIYEVAAVKKIDGVPPPRFNLAFQVSALFHHDWSRFPILEGRPQTSFTIGLL